MSGAGVVGVDVGVGVGASLVEFSAERKVTIKKT
jgi:hypothetical protein